MKNINFLFFLLLILFLGACSKSETAQNQEDTLHKILSDDVSSLNPEQVVTLYFQSWNEKQYGIMYSLISDGFKEIEPTAKTLDDFQAYMDSFFETSSGINILKVKEAYQNNKDAGINYKIEIVSKDGTKKEFENAYTLKKRSDGWKLIHPYGDNIDTT